MLTRPSCGTFNLKEPTPARLPPNMHLFLSFLQKLPRGSYRIKDCFASDGSWNGWKIVMSLGTCLCPMDYSLITRGERFPLHLDGALMVALDQLLSCDKGSLY